MTVRGLYENALIELNKLEAPSLLLEDYNYFINKAVQQYINLIYNKYDVNQQTTDDLRVLKTTAVLTPKKLTEKVGNILPANGILSATHYVVLPNDYVHLLNCVIEYKVNHQFKCYDKDNRVSFAARRLTSDMFGGIINNAYMRPMYKRPYYFINNFNLTKGEGSEFVTNPLMDKAIMDYNSESRWEESEVNEGWSENEEDAKNRASLVTSVNTPGYRIANPTEIRLELRFGGDDSIFEPEHVYVDYIKAPMFLRLTMDDINKVADTTPILEFPDYVCFEIVNIFTRLIMENASDPRIQTNPAINQTIAEPQMMAPQQGK